VPAPTAPDRPPLLYGSDGRPLAASASTPAASEQAHDETPSSAKSPARQGWERAGRFWEVVEAACIEVPGISTVLFLGKRVGWKMLIVIFLVAGTPLGEYSFLSYGVNHVVPRLAGNFGVTFESEEWSFHPFAFKAIVRNVRMRPEHDPAATPVFTAGEIEFKGSPWTVGVGIFELLTFRPFHSFHEIAVRHGELHLERSLTGHLNLTDYIDAVPDVRKREISAGAYQVNAISFTDLAIHYIEHVAGYSGNGVVETTQANIHFDGINGTVSDIRPSNTGNVMPTSVRLTGRSSDGLVEISGKLGLAEAARNGRHKTRRMPRGRSSSRSPCSSRILRGRQVNTPGGTTTSPSRCTTSALPPSRASCRRASWPRPAASTAAYVFATTIRCARTSR
jgi:hypothetical protein